MYLKTTKVAVCTQKRLQKFLRQIHRLSLMSNTRFPFLLSHFTKISKMILTLQPINLKIFQQECPEFVSEIEKEKLDFDKLDYLSDLYLRPLLKRNIEELILGCSHYPLIYDFLRKKINSEKNNITVDPDESFNFESTYFISFDDTAIKYNDDTDVIAESATFTVEERVSNQMLIDFEAPESLAVFAGDDEQSRDQIWIRMLESLQEVQVACKETWQSY